MKSLSIILICLSLFSLANPCCGDEAACTDSDRLEMADHDESDRSAETHPCSSFFTCGNCPGFILRENNATDPVVMNISEVKFTLPVKAKLSSGYTISLIKPPVPLRS